jgi:holin-like protein
MIESLALILLCQLIGEVLVRLTHLPVPGPVIGMGLLFAGLVLRGGPSEKLEVTATGLLSHLSLLFVPAGVGIMLHLDLIAAQWVPIATALVISTALTIGVTAWVMQRLVKKDASE